MIDAAASRIRMGLYGGAFDPVHNAHLSLAQAATRFLSLDELLWVPTGCAWHKARPLTAAKDRLAMLALAFKALPAPANWRVDRCEIDRPGPSYTADTLSELRHRRPGADWYLVIGADQAASLHTWERWPEIVANCTLAVVRREGVPLRMNPDVLAAARWVEIPFVVRPDSSTHIRELAAALGRGQTEAMGQLHALVPEPVARYIAQHHLYL